MNDSQPTILAIVGATASGKSQAAQAVADQTGASLVSVDSRKVYRGMDIGTSKPSREAQERYRYAMVDLVDPNQNYSAGDFAREARTIVGERVARGEAVVLVGGTGFYLDAFINGLADLPEISAEVRRQVEQDAADQGWESIRNELMAADPLWTMDIHSSDKTRLRRATEILRQTGRPYSAWLTETRRDPCPWPVVAVEIEHPREELVERIRVRTDRMIADGLVAETEGLLRAGYGEKCAPLATVGYVEAIFYIEGKLTLEAMREQIGIRTRQYAKRQRTWFRHRKYIRSIPADNLVVQRLIELWRSPNLT